MSDKVLLLHSNYLKPNLLTAYSASSANSTYPVANLFNPNRRVKVWRTAGFWEIESGSNTIVFQEQDGFDLTATIVAGTYSTDAAFLAAVKSALDTAGASTYTVERDSTTKKIKITSNGMGGDGIFKIIWTDPDSEAMADILGFSSSADDSGGLTYTADQLRIHTSEWVKFDLGIGSSPKVFVLIGERNRAIGVSSTATVKIQGNHTDIWGSPSFEKILDYDDRTLCYIDLQGFGSYRYWRIYIEDRDNPNGYIELSYAYLGEVFETTRGAVQFPFSTTLIDRSSVILSEAGFTFGDKKQKAARFDLQWFGLTVAEKEQMDDIFDSLGLTESFLVCFDPSAVFNSSVNKSVKLVKFEEQPQIQLVAPGIFSMSMRLREEL